MSKQAVQMDDCEAQYMAWVVYHPTNSHLTLQRPPDHR